MAKVAIVGSCITRDLWPLRDQAPKDLLYVSRTSLASLTSSGPVDYDSRAEPPEGLTRYQHQAVETDLRKTGLAQLVAHGPSHIIFDFIDERFDLLRLASGALVTHSWELSVGGYLTTPALAKAHPVPRLSAACERAWREACVRLKLIQQSTVLREAKLILHSARWAHLQAGDQGPVPLAGEPQILPGAAADLAAHNALLARYEAWFLQQFPQAVVVSADPAHRLADPAHRWGLSPFHYVDAYYDDIRRGLAEQGI